MESNSPPNQDLEERRRAAARAMEGEEIRQRREAREKLKEIGAAAEASELVEKLKVKELNLSPLRTLKGDMARAVREEGVSVASVALSEQARRQANGSPIAAKTSRAPGLVFVPAFFADSRRRRLLVVVWLAGFFAAAGDLVAVRSNRRAAGTERTGRSHLRRGVGGGLA